MTRPLPSHWDRVARARSDVIDGVDGVPFTHTPYTAARDRMVTADVGNRGPLPFAAKQPRVPIAGVALIAVLCASMAALPSWVITGDPSIAAVMAALLVVWSLVVAGPALLGCGSPVDRQLRRQGRHAGYLDDEDDSTESSTTQADVARLRVQLVELEQRGFRR